jgi:hypothetical protein
MDMTSKKDSALNADFSAIESKVLGLLSGCTKTSDEGTTGGPKKGPTHMTSLDDFIRSRTKKCPSCQRVMMPSDVSTSCSIGSPCEPKTVMPTEAAWIELWKASLIIEGRPKE